MSRDYSDENDGYPYGYLFPGRNLFDTNCGGAGMLDEYRDPIQAAKGKVVVEFPSMQIPVLIWHKGYIRTMYLEKIGEEC